MPTFAFITQLRAYQRFDSHIKVNTFHLATKSLRCVRRSSPERRQKKLHMQKKKSETERKLHNQKSQQAVINGPYIFKAPQDPFRPSQQRLLLVLALPCLSPHSTASRRRSKQVPGLSLANICPECHMRRRTGSERDGNLASWQSEGAASKTLNLSHERR